MNWTNLPEKDLGIDKDAKLITMNKTTELNPNADEFVPSFLKYPHANAKSVDSTLLGALGSSGKANLHQTNSSISDVSDDDAHQYWQQQLPADITPDFRVMGKEEMRGPQDLSLADLSICDGAHYSRFSASLANNTLGTRKDLSPDNLQSFGSYGRMGNGHSVHTGVENLTASVSSSVNLWGRSFLNGRKQSINRPKGHHFVEDYSTALVNELNGDDLHIQVNTINPTEYSSEHFPGFVPQHPSDVYCAKRYDFGSTIEMSNKLKLYPNTIIDDDFNQNHDSKLLVAQNLSISDFPALLDVDDQTGISKCSRNNSVHASNDYKTSSTLLRNGVDFASAVKKIVPYDSDNWRLDAADSVSVGSSRTSQLLISSQKRHGRMNSGDKMLHGSSAVRAASPWLEIGEAVGNTTSGSWEDAHGIARFEQSGEAYLLATMALKKDLSLKGHVDNTQMKAAREKAIEILQQWNLSSAELYNCGREQDHLIDLRGLRANDAMEVLIDVLSILRSTARLTGRRLQVTICVGTVLHAKSSTTPALLAVAVERYLFYKGLNFTKPVPGLLRVAIY